MSEKRLIVWLLSELGAAMQSHRTGVYESPSTYKEWEANITKCLLIKADLRDNQQKPR